jgi:hypothetical protein
MVFPFSLNIDPGLYYGVKALLPIFSNIPRNEYEE